MQSNDIVRPTWPSRRIAAARS